jgi:hypothetical protein
MYGEVISRLFLINVQLLDRKISFADPVYSYLQVQGGKNGKG